MSEEQLEQQEQQTPEEVSAAEEAAMEAGFNSVRGTTPEQEDKPAEEKPAAEEKEPETPENPEKQESAAPDENPPEKAGLANLTEAELQDLIAVAKRVPQLEGALHRTQSELGRVKAQLQKPKEEPKKEPPPTPELKRLREEYPNVAEALGHDIAELLAANRGVDSGVVESLVTKAVATSTEAVQRDVLEIFRPNWEQDANQPEFLRWLRGQPREYVERAANSEKAAVVLATFADYEAAKKASETAAAAAEAARANKDKAEKDAGRKQRRLEGAIPPSGMKAPPNAGMTEEQAFNAGFNRVRGTALR